MWIVGAGESRRERCPESDTEWNDVVVGHPLAKIEQRLTDGGLGVGRFEHCFGLSLEWTYVTHPNAHTDLLAVPQRDNDPRSDNNRIREPFFYRVCETLEQREW
jgi:hypothetical protein